MTRSTPSLVWVVVGAGIGDPASIAPAWIGAQVEVQRRRCRFRRSGPLDCSRTAHFLRRTSSGLSGNEVYDHDIWREQLAASPRTE